MQHKQGRGSSVERGRKGGCLILTGQTAKYVSVVRQAVQGNTDFTIAVNGEEGKAYDARCCQIV